MDEERRQRVEHPEREHVCRPRINEPDSRLDREQKREGEYYYAP